MHRPRKAALVSAWCESLALRMSSFWDSCVQCVRVSTSAQDLKEVVRYHPRSSVASTALPPSLFGAAEDNADGLYLPNLLSAQGSVLPCRRRRSTSPVKQMHGLPPLFPSPPSGKAYRYHRRSSAFAVLADYPTADKNMQYVSQDADSSLADALALMQSARSQGFRPVDWSKVSPAHSLIRPALDCEGISPQQNACQIYR
jgi:hypothetical protein